MTGYLLDTHTLLWAVGEPDKLSSTVRQIIVDPTNDVAMSVANTWEIAIKAHTGKLSLPPAFLTSLPSIRQRMRLGLVGISEAHAVLAGGWHWAHRDPFDRLLAAQAAVEGRVLLSSDERFQGPDAPRPPVVLW